MIRRVPLLVLGLFLGLTLLSSAAQAAPVIDSEQPVEITAQQLEVLQLEGKSVFTGDVVAKQGDMTLSADKLSVFFLEDGNRIDRLEAIGHVHFTQLDRTATAEKAVYQQEEEILSLIGNAQVKQGLNQIAGDEITLYLKEDRSLIKSSEQSRIKAVIVPEEQKDNE